MAGDKRANGISGGVIVLSSIRESFRNLFFGVVVIGLSSLLEGL